MSHSSPHRYSLPTNRIPSQISKRNLPKAPFFPSLSSCDLPDGVFFFTSDSFLFSLWIKQQVWVPLSDLLIHYPDSLHKGSRHLGDPEFLKGFGRVTVIVFWIQLLFFLLSYTWKSIRFSWVLRLLLFRRRQYFVGSYCDLCSPAWW